MEHKAQITFMTADAHTHTHSQPDVTPLYKPHTHKCVVP